MYAQNVLVPLYTPQQYGKPNMILNTALCQFPPRASKTQKGIMFIKHYSLLSRVQRGHRENGIHHITVVLTNKSLMETKQWRHRLEKRTENMNICTFSSKKDSTFTTIDQLTNLFASAKNASKLPDVLVMCTHGIRTGDILTLIDTLQNGNLHFGKIGIHQITMTIMFDEADKNAQIIAEFLIGVSKIFLKNSDQIDNRTVRDIHLITATPSPEMWKAIRRADIHELSNINKMIQTIPDHNSLTHDELLKDYRKLTDHATNTTLSTMTMDPVHYASLVLSRILQDRREGNRQGPLTIFAPAEITVASHDSMAEYFNANKFVTLILNGTRKEFQMADGTTESLDSFNAKHRIEGELFHSLIKWRELNPLADLAITGYLSVERGVTFCTIGFSFTDLIVSAYHLHNLSSLIQILGRANGGREYVTIMNIWAPAIVISKANEQIDIMNELHRRDPEVYVESDFRGKKPRELIEGAMEIPEIIQVTDEEWNTSIKKVGRSYKETLLLDLITKYRPSLGASLKTMAKKQITMPDKDASKKKHIYDFVHAAEHKTKMTIDMTKKEKESGKDMYQIFLDSDSKRFIVSVFYGSRLIKPEED